MLLFLQSMDENFWDLQFLFIISYKYSCYNTWSDKNRPMERRNERA